MRSSAPGGCSALPVLYRDRPVGTLDVTADRNAGTLRGHAVHEDEPWDAPPRSAVDAEVGDLSRWPGLALTLTRAQPR